jgi:hypothetical protein
MEKDVTISARVSKDLAAKVDLLSKQYRRSRSWLVEDALRNARLVELSMYEFDTLDGNTTPQADQDLIASYVGEVVGAGGPFESISLELGSSLSPVGAQVPPRKFTSRLIGVPVKL